MFASNSPEHIVGNHVLLRLCVPRYPPLALIRLTTQFIWFFNKCIHKIILLECLCLPANLRYYAVFKVLAEIVLSSLTSSHVADFSFVFFGNRHQVEVSGLEPLTSCLQSRRSTN